MKIAVLAVQGAFLEQEKAFQKLGMETIELRKKEDLEADFDALVLPGGESTVQGKLLKELGMFQDLKSRIENGMPTMATCAGVILLAGTLTNDSRTYFQTLPVSVTRNAYGRQLGSFYQEGVLKEIGNFGMEFIRAPLIEAASPECTILGTVNDHVVAVRYRSQLALTFHPELTDDLAVHRYFCQNIVNEIDSMP